MGFKLIGRPRTLLATRALANRFVKMDPAPHDRPLSERRLQVYQRLLKQGQFRPVTWASAYCKETGGTYRVNGKHTSLLLQGLKEIPEFYVVLEQYRCSTLKDVAKLYGTFDSASTVRNAREIYMSFAGTVTELKELSKNIISVVVPGIAYAAWGDASYRKTSVERAELMLDHEEFVLWFDKFIRGGELIAKDRVAKQRYPHLMRQSVVAAMQHTQGRSKADADKFWMAVRDETGVSPDLPDRRLSRYLLTTGMTRQCRSDCKHTAGLREMYVICLQAWNAWRRGERTDLRYNPEAKVPTII